MRVALLSSNARARDAVGNQLAEKVAYFLERGAEVRVFVQSGETPHPLVRPYLEVVSRAEASGPAWEYLAEADLVVAVYAQHYALLDFLPMLAGGRPRVLLHYHGVTPPELWRGPIPEAVARGARQRGFAWCADHVLTDSLALQDELIAATDLPAERIARLPLVVDRQRLVPTSGSRALHDRLGLGAARLLLSVGRLAGNKRTPMLVEAVARLRALTPPIHAVLIGENRDEYAAEAAEVRALAERLGVAERVHLLGLVDDIELTGAYQSADVLVLPSLHEGFCLPAVEAMAAGLPVVAARRTALPETIGDAGLTFTPDDADDLAEQLRRVLGEDRPAAINSPSPLVGEGREGGDPLRFEHPPLPNPPPPGGREQREPTGRVAVVCFRFGPDVGGGAETSLRKLALALHAAGRSVEVFTTCTRSESDWRDELPTGTFDDAGLTVHRFAVDPHDRVAHGRVVAQIVEADGRVSPEIERHYLRHSIHSPALLEALRRRRAEFDAIVTGPYLFGLTADVAQSFPEQCVVVPCFHDEPLARLAIWPRLYGRVGGLLYHSPEEQELAQARLGVNHPNAALAGTCLSAAETTPAGPAPAERPYLVYCGRYSAQKDVPRLLDWLARYRDERPGRFDAVFLGRGEVAIPTRPGFRDLGRISDERKRAVLAGARALVQLSRQESLSLVALEAWAQGTPVLAHRDGAVLSAQVGRAGGGAAIDDYEAFAEALDDLWQHPEKWRRRGERGRTYVTERYTSQDEYARRVLTVLDGLKRPLREQMRRRGPERAARCDRERWQEAFGRFLEQLLHAPPRPYREDVTVQPLLAVARAVVGERSLLLPLRVHNAGTHAVAAEGPGRTVLCGEITDLRTGQTMRTQAEGALPGLLLPGRALTASLLLDVPLEPGSYRLALWAERLGATTESPPFRAHLPLEVETRTLGGPACTGDFLDEVRRGLPELDRLRKLPDDYVDVSHGPLGGWKLLAKRTLLNNFKAAYVDVLSRRQSEVNARVGQALQHLTEACTLLDGAVHGLLQRLDRLERRLDARVESAEEPDAVPATEEESA